MLFQVGSGAAAEMFPSRRPSHEHKLAGERSSVGECYSTEHRSRRESSSTQATVPQGCLSTRQEYNPDHRFHMLLCKITIIVSVLCVDKVISQSLLFFLHSLTCLSCSWCIGQVFGLSSRVCSASACCLLITA